MSVRATQWAWETGKRLGIGGGELLVLVRVADHADHEGVCWPGEKGLSEFVGITPRRVRDNLNKLAERGLLSRTRREQKGRGRASDLIALHLDLPDETSSRSEASYRTLATVSTGRLEHVLPDAGNGPYIEEPSEEPSVEPNPPTPLPMVAGVRVDPDHWRLADSVIAAFNAAAGTRYTLAAHFRPLIGRIREHPELDASDHAAIIAGAFAKPWWKDRPGPEVVYGNPALFERAIEQRRGKRGGDLRLNEAIAARREKAS